MNKKEVSKLIDDFHGHLDECSQCRNHPFGLCPTGAALLKKAGEAGAELVNVAKRMTELQRICAWCKKDLDTGRQLTDEEYLAVNETATHGICPKCSERFSPTNSRTKKK